MEIEKGTVISKADLFEHYLVIGMDDVMSFPDYMERMKRQGVEIAEEEDVR